MMARTTRDDLAELLSDWTYAATRMMQGLEVTATGAVGGSPEAPPDDTGEALGLPASNLTITFGFGPSLFDARFGLEGQRPAGLERLPAFLGDDLDPLRSDGDLCIQACADDPQVAVHAIRNLSRIAFGGRRSVVAARIRPHLEDHVATDDSAEPLRLQGRNRQHPRRRHRRPRRERVGVGIRGPGVARGRVVPGRAADLDADRDVGPHASRRAGPRDRPRQGQGGTAVGRRRVHGARLLGGGSGGNAGDRPAQSRARLRIPT